MNKMILDEFNIKYPKYSVDVWVSIYGIVFCENCLFEMINEYEENTSDIIKFLPTQDIKGLYISYSREKKLNDLLNG